jgi:hypothetical protein
VDLSQAPPRGEGLPSVARALAIFAGPNVTDQLALLRQIQADPVLATALADAVRARREVELARHDEEVRAAGLAPLPPNATRDERDAWNAALTARTLDARTPPGCRTFSERLAEEEATDRSIEAAWERNEANHAAKTPEGRALLARRRAAVAVWHAADRAMQSGTLTPHDYGNARRRHDAARAEAMALSRRVIRLNCGRGYSARFVPQAPRPTFARVHRRAPRRRAARLAARVAAGSGDGSDPDPAPQAAQARVSHPEEVLS